MHKIRLQAYDQSKVVHHQISKKKQSNADFSRFLVAYYSNLMDNKATSQQNGNIDSVYMREIHDAVSVMQKGLADCQSIGDHVKGSARADNLRTAAN